MLLSLPQQPVISSSCNTFSSINRHLSPDCGTRPERESCTWPLDRLQGWTSVLVEGNINSARQVLPLLIANLSTRIPEAHSIVCLRLAAHQSYYTSSEQLKSTHCSFSLSTLGRSG